KSTFGFDKKEVQGYLEFVAREFETLLTELGQARERVGRQDEELFRFREREETLKEALVTAQKMSEDMRVQAKKEADLVIAEAEMKAERIIPSAHGRLLQILEEIGDLKKQRVQLVEGLKHVLSTHQKLLEQEPATRSSGDDESVTYLRTRGQKLPEP